MTTLDPSHFPLHQSRRSGQAFISSLPADESNTGPKEDNDESTGPSWRGAWARRQAAKEKEVEESDSDGEDDHGASKKKKRIAVAPIPDFRFEEGVLLSIRPFLHRIESPKLEHESAETSKEGTDRTDSEEKAALVSGALTAEGAKDGVDDVFAGPLRIEWGPLSYVIFRDQVIFPLLQGLLWGIGGLYLNHIWNWNRARLASARKVPRRSTADVLASWGLKL